MKRFTRLQLYADDRIYKIIQVIETTFTRNSVTGCPMLQGKKNYMEKINPFPQW
jgi:hypothetical protein